MPTAQIRSGATAAGAAWTFLEDELLRGALAVLRQPIAAVGLLVALACTAQAEPTDFEALYGDVQGLKEDVLDLNRELFPYLQGFKERASSPDTIEYKIGEIFGEIKNKFQSGYSLRDAFELM